MGFFVYILRCANDAFYTGWSTDPQKRLKQHNSGKGAKYTQMNNPSELVYIEELPDKISALKREKQIKKLSHQQKSLLINKLTPLQKI